MGPPHYHRGTGARTVGGESSSSHQPSLTWKAERMESSHRSWNQRWGLGEAADRAECASITCRRASAGHNPAVACRICRHCQQWCQRMVSRPVLPRKEEGPLPEFQQVAGRFLHGGPSYTSLEPSDQPRSWSRTRNILRSAVRHTANSSFPALSGASGCMSSSCLASGAGWRAR